MQEQYKQLQNAQGKSKPKQNQKQNKNFQKQLEDQDQTQNKQSCFKRCCSNNQVKQFYQRGKVIVYENTNKEQAKPQEERSFIQKCCSCCSLNICREFFDVASSTVAKRILQTLMFWRGQFFTIQPQNYDLYGPFWIFTTLIFSIPCASNIASYINNPQDFKYNFKLLPIAYMIVYSYGFIYPMALTLILKCLGSDATYRETLCAYGYSWFVLILCVFVCSIPNTIVQTVVVAYAFISSTLFLLINYNKELSADKLGKSRLFVIGAMVVIQIAIGAVFRFLFFQYIYTEDATTES